MKLAVSPLAREAVSIGSISPFYISHIQAKRPLSRTFPKTQKIISSTTSAISSNHGWFTATGSVAIGTEDVLKKEKSIFESSTT